MSFSVHYKNDELFMEEVPVRDIADKVGTPCFIYSYGSIAESFRSYKEALSDIDPIICFSTKANSNLAVLNAFADLGAGFDIVSVGELNRVIKAGGDMSKVVFSGVGKTDLEIKEAIEAGILFFNVESVDELNSINEVGIKIGKKAPIALRVNPDIDPKTHPYISTGFKKSKFGIELSKSAQVYKDASKMEGINIVGIDAHIGSQIFELSSFSDSVKKLIRLADILVNEGIEIKYIDIGGGLGINYKIDEEPPSTIEYAETIISETTGSPYKIVIEPGRSLIGNSGVMVTKVLYTKEGSAKNFVIVDAAMNDLIRPAFYNSHHEIITVKQSRTATKEVDIVGPICESGDFLAVDREFPEVHKGDYLSVLSAGAYGFVMSSNYNSRPRAAEVMIMGNKFEIIKERENFDDLIKGERIPDFS
ncbi:MAG: diaminopimelate decarboxylase [Thermodesulfobacteriota bacterium]